MALPGNNRALARVAVVPLNPSPGTQLIDIMKTRVLPIRWPTDCTAPEAMCAPADRTVKGGTRALPRPSRIASAVLTELGIFAASIIATVLDSRGAGSPAESCGRSVT